jgi:predicted O-methyltransferase YrrM
MIKSSGDFMNLRRINLTNFKLKITELISMNRERGFEINLNLGRMENLMSHIENSRVSSILEIGVWKGENALHMLKAASKVSDNVTYVGVDLFEDLASQANLESEASLWPESKENISMKLTKSYPRAQIELIPGYSKDSLPTLIGRKFQLIFIDGGHSYETVLGDWTIALKLISHDGYIFIDDYTNIEATILDNFGVRKLVDSLDTDRYSVQILDPEDIYEQHWGVLKTRMVRIGPKKSWSE